MRKSKWRKRPVDVKALTAMNYSSSKMKLMGFGEISKGLTSFAKSVLKQFKDDKPSFLSAIAEKIFNNAQ